MDLISNKRQEVDDLWREMTMYLMIHNSVAVVYQRKSGEVFTEEYPINLLGTDTGTDVTTFFDKGRLYRQSIQFVVPNVKMLFTGNKSLIEEVPVRIVNMTTGEE